MPEKTLPDIPPCDAQLDALLEGSYSLDMYEDDPIEEYERIARILEEEDRRSVEALAEEEEPCEV